MITRVFNIVTITALLSFELFVTGFFFIGSQETFDRQFDSLPEYFFRRTLGGIVIGILGCVFLVLGNLAWDKSNQAEKRNRISKMVLRTLLLSVLISIIGTGIFFYH